MKKLLGMCCVLVFLFCTKDKLAGTIDSTDTGIMGKVSNSTGKTVANANVQLFKNLDTSKTALAQMSTDNNGSFTFDNLPPGSYNVWIESNDSLVAFIDSVYVPNNTQVKRDATLGKSGSVMAIVGLQTGDDPRSVFVQALGTQKYSNVDSAGFFTIPKLAEGEYTLRLVSTIQGYTPTYKTIAVVSGVDDTLKDTIKLIYTGIPPVANIKAEYDQFTGIAKVSWSRMAYANLYDYLIYRDISGSIALSTAPIAASTDTVFYDTLFGNPATSLIGWPDSSIGNSFIDTSNTLLKYRYRVTIRNKSNEEGAPYNFADINGANPLDLIHIISPNDNAKFTNGTNLSVSWNVASQAQSYQMHVSSKPDFSDTVFSVAIMDTVKALPSLALGYYYVHVRAVGPKEEWGFWSIPRKFVVNGGLFANTFGQAVNFSVDKLVRANDGGDLLVGSSNSGSLHIVKADSNGNEEWHQSYDYLGTAIDAIQTDDNGYLILGSLSYLLKINFNGSVAWSKSNNDTSAFSPNMKGTSILKTPDNGFILGAVINTELYNISLAHMLKFNSDGSKQWDRFIDTSEYPGPNLLQMGADSFAAIDLKSYDNTLIQGSDTLLVTICDYSGNTKTSNRIKVDLVQNIYSVCKTDPGEILVGGEYSILRMSPDWNVGLSEGIYLLEGIQSVSGGGFIQVSNGAPSLPAVITKKNEEGTTLWSKSMPFYGGQLPFVVDPDGSIVAAFGSMLFKISKDGVSFEQ